MNRGSGIVAGAWLVLMGVWGSTSALAQQCQQDIDCDDGIFCTLDRCFFNTCSNTHNNTQCNDGVFCNGLEFCDAPTDACASGTPPTCPPGLFCSPVLDNCVECDADAQCSDGVFCNGMERCNQGLCQDGTPVNCSHLNTECITGICSEALMMCVQGAPCDDGNLCTDDVCITGSGCVNPPNYQVGVECCNPATGGTTLINDGDACTTDTCNASTGEVLHLPISCNDGNACTINDVCINNGAGCAGTDVNTIACVDDSDCPVGSCNTLNGFCNCSTCTSPAQCNDGVACTVDDCVGGTCTHTANDAACATGLFCSQQRCDRNLGCVLTDFCTPQAGNPCPSAATCNESTDLCGGCLPPTVVVTSRYLIITPPAAGSVQMALRVVGDCGDSTVSCVAKYVDFDSPQNPNDLTAGRLIATPVYRTAAAWGTVNVRSTDLRPGRVYRVYSECNPGAVRSAGVAAGTSIYGDTNNNGITNFADINRVVTGFQGGFSPTLTKEQTDLMAGSCGQPDRTVDFQDISDAVKAFQGLSFPCAACP